MLAIKQIRDFLLSTLTGSKDGIRDTAVSLLPQFVLAISSIVVTVVIARILGPSDMGRYALVLSVSLLIQGIADLGIGQTAVRYAALAYQNGQEKQRYIIIIWAIIVRFIITLLLYGLLIILMPWVAGILWKDASLSPLTLAYTLTSLLYICPIALSLYFQSERAFLKSAIVISVMVLIPLLSLAFVLAIGKLSLDAIVSTTVLCSFVYSLITAYLLMHYFIGSGMFVKRNLSIKMILALLKCRCIEDMINMNNERTAQTSSMSSFAILLGIATILGILFLRMDLWIAGAILPKDAVGLYAVALRFAMPIVVLSSAVNTAFLPRASCSREMLPELARNAGRLMLLSLLPVIAYCYFAPLLSPILFGCRYGGIVVLTARVLCTGYAFSLVFAPFVIIGYSLGFIRWYYILNFLTLIAQIILYIILVPRYGMLALASVFTILMAFNNIYIGVKAIAKIGRMGKIDVIETVC